ncbi:MAG: hypothetical protein II602_00155 [Erysipelotrichales bacterium]|nr:hypothetical protein [Erysipelotrichales bacterium]
MKAYLAFKLKEHFRIRSVKVRMAFVFAITGAVLFSDQIVKGIGNALKTSVYNDAGISAAMVREEGFLAAEEKENAGIWITKEETWVVTVRKSLSETEKRNLEHLLEKAEDPARKAVYETREESGKDFTWGLLVLTFFYFEALSKGTAIAAEVIDEKLTGMCDIALGGMKPEKHMYAMILYAWILRILDVLWIVFSAFVFGALRLWTLGMPDLPLEVTESSADVPGVLAPLGMMVTGMWLYQTVIAVYVAKIRKSEEVSGYLMVPNAVFFVSYFVITDLFEKGKTGALALLGCVPLWNSLAVPLAYLSEGVPGWIVMAEGALMGVYIFVMRKILRRKYRERILT